MKYYKQVELKNGNTVQTAWIESYGAKKGFRVTLKDVDDPTILWTVTAVYSGQITETEARFKERESVNFRKSKANI